MTNHMLLAFLRVSPSLKISDQPIQSSSHQQPDEQSLKMTTQQQQRRSKLKLLQELKLLVSIIKRLSFSKILDSDKDSN